MLILAGRIHMLITVLSVMSTAVFVDKKLPYFPIEVSRMAASGPAAGAVFRIGCCTLLATIYVFDGYPCATTYLLCFALAIIAVIDDVSSWLAHMMGVCILFACALIQAFERPRLIYTCMIPACIIYIARIVLKGMAVHFLERKQTMASLFDMDVQRANLAYGADIMYGRKKAKFTETDMIFRLGGFLQWIVFLFLAPLF